MTGYAPAFPAVQVCADCHREAGTMDTHEHGLTLYGDSVMVCRGCMIERYLREAETEILSARDHLKHGRDHYGARDAESAANTLLALVGDVLGRRP